MKLNFRNVDGGGTLAHGVTPILIPPPSGGALSSRSAPHPVQGGYPDTEPSLNGTHQAAYVPARPSSRRCHVSFGTGILYLMGILLILSLPFALPVAVTHAVRIVDRSRSVNSFGEALKPGETPSDLSLGMTNQTSQRASESNSFLPSTDQRAQDPLLPPVNKVSIEPTSFASPSPPSPISASLRERVAPNQMVTGAAASNMQLSNDVSSAGIHTKSSFNSYGVSETSGTQRKGPLSDTDRLEPILDEWSKYVVVRHGNLYMSETFEARLNEQVANKLFERHPEIFGHIQKDCGGKPDISFSFKASPRIQAELEIVTQCGPQGSSCTLRPRVDDLRRLHVNVGSGKAGEHFLTADATNESERVTWGPLVGPLKVALLEDSMMALKKTCLDPTGTATRILSVGQVKQMLRDIALLERALNERADTENKESSSRFDVFRYDAHPHYHIQQGSNGGDLENRSVRQEREAKFSGEEGNRRWNQGMGRGTSNNWDQKQRSREAQKAVDALADRRRDWVRARVESGRGQ